MTPVPSHPSPAVTVVIQALRRRQFLLGAARSIDIPDGRRSEFEVLVVKDFEDPTIDEELRALGCRTILLPEGPLGPWIARAAAEARGAVVAFLDDDDRFLPHKLEHLRRVFQEHPEAGYYHHRTLPEGSVPSLPAPLPPSRSTSTVRTIGPEQCRRRFTSLWRKDLAFNLSSMAVARSILTAHQERLARIQVSVSAFLFYAALASGSTLIEDDGAWTAYHEEGRTPQAGVRRAPRNPLRLAELARARRTDARVLLELARELRLPAAEAPARAGIAGADLILALEGEPCGRRQVLRGLMTAVRYRPTGALVGERRVLLLGALFLLSPSSARERWFRAKEGYRRGPPATVPLPKRP